MDKDKRRYMSLLIGVAQSQLSAARAAVVSMEISLDQARKAQEIAEKSNEELTLVAQELFAAWREDEDR